jgi:hypothetical protein
VGTKLPPRELELYQRIDEILWRDWDPIGISGIPDACDEYQGYLPVVYRFALEGDREKIANYLSSVTSERMGLPAQRDRDLKIGDLILAEKVRIGIEANDA